MGSRLDYDTPPGSGRACTGTQSAEIDKYQTNQFSLSTHTKSNHLPHLTTNSSRTRPPPARPPPSHSLTMRVANDNASRLAEIPHRPGPRLPRPRRPPHLP